MDNLRLILLILGVIVVVGVYVYARGQTRRRVRHQARADLEREPVIGLDEEPADVLMDEALPPMNPLGGDDAPTQEEWTAEPVVISANRPKPAPAVSPREATASTAPARDKIVALHVVAPAHSPFRGKDLLRAFELAGLVYGEMKIYHRVLEVDGAPHNACFVASMVEPGTFDPEHMDSFATPGVSLFLQLPGPVEGVRALDDMVQTARTLAAELNGELRDETRSALSKQRIEHLRGEVLEFERRLRVERAKA